MGTHRETNKQTDKQTNRQTDKQTNNYSNFRDMLLLCRSLYRNMAALSSILKAGTLQEEKNL
jgi:hypothetical protein